MSRTGWYSQPYPPEGGTAAEGIRNQLGRPALDLLTILVREAAQNSWDARSEGSSRPVDFSLDLRTVGPAERRSWYDALLSGAPNDVEAFPLLTTLGRSGAGELRPVRILTVSDRGTKGLGGPTTANILTPGDRDFVTFVRNVGEPRDTHLGGGTYGFGKGIFYLLSRPGTILVYTRCHDEHGRTETRLMGCTLWKSYVSEADSCRYTGRHWWGDISESVVEPLKNSEADAMARKLGLQGFAADEYGTTIVVVDPDGTDFDDSPDGAAHYIAETITWQLWPKMLARADGSVPMRVRVFCDGRDVPVPDPETTSPVKLFTQAYRKLDVGQELRCLKPKKLLGSFSVVKQVLPGIESTAASRAAGVDGLVHHVCLMRPAELVVKYHEGPKPPTEYQGYAGVFRADTGMDDAFAQSEPPTHDAWNPQSLSGQDARFVRTTFTRIREQLHNLLSESGRVRSVSRAALGAASSRFSGLMGGSWGVGGATDYVSTLRASAQEDSPIARRIRRKEKAAAADRGIASEGSDRSAAGTPAGHSATRTIRPRVRYIDDPYFEDHGADTFLAQDFELPVAVPQQLRADLGVILPGTGGRETDPPAGAASPELHAWEDPSGTLHTEDVLVTEGGPERWRVLVRPAPDTVTDIVLQASTAPEEA